MGKSGYHVYTEYILLNMKKIVYTYTQHILYTRITKKLFFIYSLVWCLLQDRGVFLILDMFIFVLFLFEVL